MPPRRVLLDECIDRRLGSHIVGHNVSTVPQAGWAGLKNGALLKKASTAFDVFITADRNLYFQQNLTKIDMGVIALRASSNRLQDLIPLVPATLDALLSIKAGQVVFI